MEWTKPVDKLPADGEAVMVRRREKIAIGRYDAEGKRFVLNDGSEYPITIDVMWMELLRDNENLG
jgi:hypothetical protein